MPCRNARCVLAIALAALATAASAQAQPDEATPPVLTTTTWTSDQGTNAQTHARNCSVFPLKTGIYPLFYLERGYASMSVEGAPVTPLGATLQVDSNAPLDGGFPEPTSKVVAALIAQIGANGETLRVSRMVIANKRMETVTDDIVLDGAVAEFDKCKAWLAP
jgi:hypothetical protein